jgi:hypothetical protein
VNISIKNFLQCDEAMPNSVNVCCPSCGDLWTHGVGIESIERKYGDAKTGSKITVRGHIVSRSDDVIKNNISERRGSLSLRFSCEQGCDDFMISFYQHKGITFVDSFILKGQGNSWLSEVEE